MMRNNGIRKRWRERLPAQSDDQGRLSVLVGVFFASGLLCWSVMVEGPQLTLAITAIPLLLPIITASAAARENGIMDPTALFPVFFALYNGVLLIRFLSDEVRNHLIYPVTFSPEVFFRAGVLSALSAIFIAISWALWKRPLQRRVVPPVMAGWFTVGTVLSAIGIALYFVQYLQIGGYWAALAINRAERYNRMADTFSLPSSNLLLVGLAMMAASSRGGLRRMITVLVTGLWCVIVMAQGERRMVLQALFAVVSAAMFTSLSPTRLKLKHLLIAIVAYAGFSIAGELRLLIPYVAGGKALHSADLNIGHYRVSDLDDMDLFLDTMKPEYSELAGPYLSVLHNTDRVRDYSFGSSYIGSIFAFLPRALYPGTKPPSPAEELVIDVHRGGGPASGWGYSPIAEAFLNFGLPGVCVISSLWMVAFIVLSGLRGSDWGLVTAAVLSSESINVNRIDFRTVYLESFFCVMAVLFAALAVRVLYQEGRKPVESPMVQFTR